MEFDTKRTLSRQTVCVGAEERG